MSLPSPCFGGDEAEELESHSPLRCPLPSALSEALSIVDKQAAQVTPDHPLAKAAVAFRESVITTFGQGSKNNEEEDGGSFAPSQLPDDPEEVISYLANNAPPSSPIGKAIADIIAAAASTLEEPISLLLNIRGALESLVGAYLTQKVADPMSIHAFQQKYPEAYQLYSRTYQDDSGVYSPSTQDAVKHHLAQLVDTEYTKNFREALAVIRVTCRSFTSSDSPLEEEPPFLRMRHSAHMLYGIIPVDRVYPAHLGCDELVLYPPKPLVSPTLIVSPPSPPRLHRPIVLTFLRRFLDLQPDHLPNHLALKVRQATERRLHTLSASEATQRLHEREEDESTYAVRDFVKECKAGNVSKMDLALVTRFLDMVIKD